MTKPTGAAERRALQDQLGVTDKRAAGTAGEVLHTQLFRGPVAREQAKKAAKPWKGGGASIKIAGRRIKVDGLEIQVVVLVVRAWAPKPKAKKAPTMWDGRAVPVRLKEALKYATLHRQQQGEGGFAWTCTCRHCADVRSWAEEQAAR